MNIAGVKGANIGQSAHFGKLVSRHCSQRGMGQNAHIEICYVLWDGWGFMDCSLSAKAVASPRLRTLILM